MRDPETGVVYVLRVLPRSRAYRDGWRMTGFHWAPVPKSPLIARKLRQSEAPSPGRGQMNHPAWEWAKPAL
jgi:hypothetical protein